MAELDKMRLGKIQEKEEIQGYKKREIPLLKKYEKKIIISIYSFDYRLDFQSGFVRCEIDYGNNDKLSDIIKKIPHDNFSNKEMGVDLDFLHIRLNGLAILEDLGALDLVNRFGKIWYLEPLSRRFAKKDLTLNLEFAYAKYNDFFNSAPFITPSERVELKKYLSINFICQYDDEYYGDGFFLYIKWLMNRHPRQKRYLLETIASPVGGIMNHIPLASLMYPKNGILDNEIEYLQGMLLNPSRCPVKQNKWSSMSSKISDKYTLNPKTKLIDEESAISRCPIFNKDMGKIDLSKSLAHMR